MSKSERETFSNASRNSWRRLRTAVSLSRFVSDQFEDGVEDCEEGGEGIFETQPLAVGSKFDALAMPM
jgi:hypothetical protein